MDTTTIRLIGLRAFGRHGVREAEKRDGQDFVVDVTLRVDASQAIRSDQLHDTLDYDDLALDLVRIVNGEPVQLLEKLAGILADRCTENTMVRSVEVTVHKPKAPINARFDDVSVTITRARDAQRHRT
ncbi:MAG: dihydroneopterin aldolase [Actinophytocola sp.]|uniref:dihydroneopterin aldolase n=1 Tax=Actinophytocola sp. TaxID=1872138 RepID=UPI003C7524E2